MERTLRHGDREITRMGLGTNRLTNTPAHQAFVRAAVDAGIGLIDTAYTYTDGESEETIGAALAAGSAPVVVATKGGMGAGNGRPEILRRQIETSLRRLRTERIDLYYLHRVYPETPLEDSLGAISEFVDRGQIGLVGLSEVGIEEIERGRRVVPIAAVQNHYNLDERRYDDVVDHCAAEGLVFVPFFPLRGVANAALNRIAGRRETTPSQIALAWLLHRSPAILPIPGTLSLEHVKENLGALDIELTPEELSALD